MSKRRNCSIGKLRATIVRFGRFRKDLRDKSRIDQSIPFIIQVLLRTANDRRVRISQKAAALDFHSQVSVKGKTWTAFEKVPESARQIRSNKAVLARPARHPKHFAVKKLTFELRAPFLLQKLGFC